VSWTKPYRGTQLNKTHPLARGLVGAWIMNEGVGSLVNDSIGYSDGSVWRNVPVWTPDGILFDSTLDQRIDITSPGIGAIGVSNYTVFATVTQKSVATNQGLIAFDNYNPTWVIDANGTLRIYDGGNKGNTTLSVFDNVKTSVAWVRNSIASGGLSQYVNGVRDLNSYTHSDSILSPTTLVFGSDRVGGTNTTYNGIIHNVYIFNVALTPSEISQLHQNPYAMFQQPTPVWMMGDSGTPTGYTLEADPGAYSLAGSDSSLLFNRLINADNGSLAISGQDTTLLYDRLLSAEAGTFSLLGQDVSLLYNRSLSADSGAYTLTGQDVSLLAQRILTLESGSLEISGQDTSLLFNRSIGADSGAYYVSGQDASLIKNYILGCDSGDYTLLGFDADLIYNSSDLGIIAESGSYAISGFEANLRYNRVLSLDPGEINLSSQDASLLFNRLLTSASGSFNISGQDADLLKHFVLSLETGSFNLVGSDVTLTWSGETLPSGELIITFSTKKPTSSFGSKTPGTTFGSKKPDITISI